MPSPPKSNPPRTAGSAPASNRPRWLRWFFLAMAWALGLAVAAGAALVLTIAVALAMAYPNLPDVSELADYRPSFRCACIRPKAR